MAARYVCVDRVRLEPLPDFGDETMVLIYGDEVATLGPVVNGHVPVEFRGRKGVVSSKALDDKARLECYFLDVGQGDSAFIVTPGRRKILIDGGRSPAKGRIGEAQQFLNWK